VIKDRDGTMITDAEKVKTRWKQYFEELYNDPNPVDESFLENLDWNSDVEPTPNIMIEEVSRAIERLKTRKAPGIDNITAEEIKAATEGKGLQIIFQLCQRIWNEEVFPTEWKKAVIVPLYKKKDKLDCNNYRGISLLCHSSKIVTAIIMERIKKRTEEILSEEQAGFRPSRSTTDQIFTLRQLAEKYTDFSRDLFVCYVDFKKAFDSVWRIGLWKVMRRLGYPEKVVRMLESLYKGTFSAVRVGADVTEWFETIVGLLQGCMLSPILFNIFLEVIIASALGAMNEGAVMNGRIINNLRFADDIAVLAESQEDLRVMVTKIVEESGRMGMKINTGKTEVQHIGREKAKVSIHIENQELKQVEEFVYLGGNMSEDASTDQDLRRRIGLACGAMQSLSCIWKSNDISNNTKTRVYETLVLSILLYNSETWILREADKSKLRVFEMNCLRKIQGITRRDRKRNDDIRRELGLEIDIVQRIQKKRLGYFGHVVRMNSERLPNVALFGHVHGSRRRGRPKKRWLNNLDEDLNEMGLNIVEACRLAASDRNRWRDAVLGLSQRGLPSP
jgi:Reverse transcriptase (RNA-dependent DNA polymerase)